MTERPTKIQESAAPYGFVVSAQHFYRWAPEVVSCSRAVEVVPLAVAENLAAALGAWCPGSRVLADYRAAYPAKETP